LYITIDWHKNIAFIINIFMIKREILFAISLRGRQRRTSLIILYMSYYIIEYMLIKNIMTQLYISKIYTYI